MSAESRQADLSGEIVEYDRPIEDLTEDVDGMGIELSVEKEREKACPHCNARVTINSEWTGAYGHERSCPYWIGGDGR